MLYIAIHSTGGNSQDLASTPIVPSNHADEDPIFTLKVMLVHSIFLTCNGVLILLFIYNYIRLYQQKRNDRFKEQSKFDQIDYLIHLICEQEKLLEMRKEELQLEKKNDDKEWRRGQAATEVANEDIIRRYNQLSKKFYDELDILHEMMSRNDLELKVQKKGVK